MLSRTLLSNLISVLSVDISDIKQQTVGDLSGNDYIGLFTADYEIEFDTKTGVPKRKKPKVSLKLGTKNKGKAF